MLSNYYRTNFFVENYEKHSGESAGRGRNALVRKYPFVLIVLVLLQINYC